jgi:prefoldin subunit 5
VEQDKADKLKILQEQVQELTKRVARLEKEIDKQRSNEAGA